MSNQQSSLQVWKDLATILSLIAVPVIVAVMAMRIEESIAQQQVQKDYVLIALEIINDTEDDDALRSWAVDVLEKNSPVPFAPAVRASLVRGEFEGFAEFLRREPVPFGSLPEGFFRPGIHISPTFSDEDLERLREQMLKWMEEAESQPDTE